MPRRRTISIGTCYVDNARKVAREVLAANDQTVTFYTYHLDTGNSCGSPSECTRQDFVRWADHEATPFELARLQLQERERDAHPAALNPHATSFRSQG